MCYSAQVYRIRPIGNEIQEPTSKVVASVNAPPELPTQPEVGCQHEHCRLLVCVKCEKQVWSCCVYESRIQKRADKCTCTPCHKAANQNWRANNNNGQIRNWQNRGLNVTSEDYEIRMKEQDGKCAICKQVCITGRALAFDHNHETMQPRGLLCFDCNVMLGKAKDSPLILTEAVSYILRYLGGESD